MKFSVIIPVYNATLYVRNAVVSALAQPETAEIILVEDGSSDNSLRVCEDLVKQEKRVKLFRHPGGVNKGAGATRNLGVKNSNQEWIAFLDADDFFLPGRFSKMSHIFAEHRDIDGIFEATGFHFYSEPERDRFARRGDVLTTFSRAIVPEDMFKSFCPIGNLGYAVPSGFVVRKAALMQVGLFDESVAFVHEDTILFIKLAAECRIITGELITPVALRGIHDSGHISVPASLKCGYISRLRMWRILFKWGRTRLSPERFQLLCAAMNREVTKCYTYASCRVRGRLQAVKQLLLVICFCPITLTSLGTWRGFFASFRRP